MSNWKIPLADTSIGEEEIEAVKDVLRSGWLTMGPITHSFEQKFAEYIGVKHALAVTNCTAALHLAYVALEIQAGDKVICPSLTFVATANAIRYTGAVPVFADITSTDNLNISPDSIRSKIDDHTKGICVVHYGGYPCDMENILKIANEHNLYIVEDVAHAPGAACEVQTVLHSTSNTNAMFKRCGSIGNIGCFSFFSNKNMTTAEGGMLTTDSDVLAERIRILRSHGMTSLTWDREQGHSFSYDVVDDGFNYRIDEIRSAIGLKQLEKLNGSNQNRLSIQKMYINLLKTTNEISIPFIKHEGVCTPHIFPILLNQSNRHEFMEFLKTKGIQTSIHYPLIHKFSLYQRNYRDVKLEICESIEDRMVTLPLFSSMSNDNVYYVVDAIKSWFSKNHD